MSSIQGLRWDLSPAEIKSATEKIIQRSKNVLDSVAQLPQDKVSFDSVIRPLAEEEALQSTESTNIDFPQYVHPDKEIRDASVACSKQLEEYNIDADMRPDVYKQVKLVFDSADRSKLNAEEIRLLEKMELGYRRMGLALSDDKQTELKQLKKQLSGICIDFSTNVNSDSTSIRLTRDELTGLSEDFIDNLDKEQAADGTSVFIVTMKYPHYFPIMNKASNVETRKKMEKAYTTRCDQNIKLLELAVQLRVQIAKLLGYENHAQFVLDDRMAKTPAAVRKFLHELRTKLNVLAQSELNVLSDLKRHDVGDSVDSRINSYDFRYYHQKLLESKYQVDEDAIKQYFQLGHVTDKMLALYQQLLRLKFVKVDRPPVWHQDVEMYQVKNSSDGSLVGYFYLDLFPRDNKYSHAACFKIHPAYAQGGDKSGQHQLPVSAMVANFPKPTSKHPSLLSHNDVVTYFHEFGHVMHQICSITQFSRFHGTNVERDFVEAPSQMLENWCWEDKVLKQLSGHVEKKDANGIPLPLPDDLISNLVKAKNVNAGLMNLRQIFFATFDLTIHELPDVDHSLDTSKLYNRLKDEISLTPAISNTYGQSTFGHVMGGYDAGYYGYLWSQVFSADMFHSVFKKQGIDSAAMGQKYRECILKPGGSRDGMDSLKSFLGREPNSEAFLRALGL
ncbi:hypothetical protein MIR68_005494 [Amoeboaphelidium protococcarum]|nr:hypothetical protein MIR68_005494 [Amoeboaphelidium protococcarum]